MWVGYWLLILKLRLIVLFSFFSLCDLMFDFAFVFGWVDLLLIALLFRLSWYFVVAGWFDCVL